MPRSWCPGAYTVPCSIRYICLRCFVPWCLPCVVCLLWSCRSCRAVLVSCAAGLVSYGLKVCRVPCLPCVVSCWCGRAVVCGCCGWCRMRFYCEGARLSGCARLPVPVLCWCVPHCPVPCAVLIMWATSCPVLCSSFSSVVACRTMCRVAVVKCSCPLSSHAVLSSALVLFLCAVLSSCCRASLLYPYLDLGAVSSCLTHPARSGSDPIIDTFQLRERSKIRRNTNPAE